LLLLGLQKLKTHSPAAGGGVDARHVNFGSQSVVHINVGGVAGEGAEDIDERIHVGKTTDKAEVNKEVVLVVAAAHPGNVPLIAGKPPPRL